MNNTNGDEQQVKNLSFNFMDYSEYEDPELSREFNNTLMGLNFRFEDKTDSGNDYKIAYFKITNVNSNIKLKNTILSVGDNINQIPNVEFNPTENGKVAYFRKQDSNDSFIFWTDSTGIIQSIEYNHY
ncbi:MAG: hypothetical protein CL868_07825 [Cytophagaceae bacterium]|nr:hypothetical protein [Cytophagaceae bacterium]